MPTGRPVVRKARELWTQNPNDTGEPSAGLPCECSTLKLFRFFGQLAIPHSLYVQLLTAVLHLPFCPIQRTRSSRLLCQYNLILFVEVLLCCDTSLSRPCCWAASS